MASQQAIDEALDKLEIENEELITDETLIKDKGEVETKKIVEVETKKIVEVEANKNPPGYIDNVEDWVAAGKDPKLFKSPELYSAEYERIQEIKDLKETMRTVVDGVSEWKEQQQLTMADQLEQAKVNALAELEQAKEDDDVDAAIKAQKKIGELEKPRQQEAQKPHPVLTKFYSKNLILDKNSPQYDDEVYQDTSMYQAAILDELTGGNRQMQLTESQIERSMKLALSKAKELSPDKFVSPRNKRKSAPASSRTNIQPKDGDYDSKLRNVKSNTMNKNDTSAALDVYNMLKGKAEAIKDPVSKAKALKAAETYAKTVLGE